MAVKTQRPEDTRRPAEVPAPAEETEKTPEPGCEEIRLALALNGGVSLAVWMGGCTAELDRARRARDDPGGKGVYDRLARCFGRRLEIDILTGSSAGGINAALLGGTIAHDRELPPEFLRKQWIELGDLGKILHHPAEAAPTSLMNGKLFHKKLGDVFDRVLTDASFAREDGDHVPDVPYLDVTMTDVLGTERKFRDAWGCEFVAREHRPRFRFRKRDHFTKEALADAARTSASFPLAFEPWRVAGDSRVLAGLRGQTWGIDGGLLDNAPIKAALDLIPTRSASSSVRRYFCYVNGDPSISREETIGPLPGLGQVGGHVVNLPRVAPLVDHLYAIRNAVDRPLRAAEAQDHLLRMDLTHLEKVAESLFPAYAQRRTLESLEGILPEPSDATATFEQLGRTNGRLPWIPRSWPGSHAIWEWGLRPAQRILHLALDILRPAIAATVTEEEGKAKRRALLATRIAIDSHLEKLDAAHDDVVGADATLDPSRIEDETAIARVNAACREATLRAPRAAVAVEEGLTLLRKCMTEHCELFPKTYEVIFGDNPVPEEEIRCFVKRALAIEVVRRAFAPEADIESAEDLNFVQLTPETPSPILSVNPLHLPGPNSAKQKLTGVGLGHFAGFFRRSWRANDFMWGRLDAAARLVDLLLDAPSSDFGTGASEGPDARATERAEFLAEYLIPEEEPGNGEAAKDDWLVEETLASAGVDLSTGSLREVLEKAMAKELRAAEAREDAAVGMGADPSRDGVPRTGAALPLTRALFQRAAQAEILREELPTLVRESGKDRELGSVAEKLDWQGAAASQDLERQVKAIRALYLKRRSLPTELTGTGEAVSDLGLRTMTHASFVGLAAVKTAGMPMSKYLGFTRPPLLAIAGSVALKRWVRATAALGFWAAAMFLASRAVTEEGEATLSFSAAWSPWTLMTLAALLGVAGFVLVPGLRMRHGVEPGKNFIFAALLALSGGVLAGALALLVGDISVERLLVAPGADKPPEEVIWAVLASIGFVSISRFPLPGRLQMFRSTLESLRRDLHWKCGLLALAFLALSAFTVQSLIRALGGPFWWQGLVALVALAAAPVGAAFAVSLGVSRKEEEEKEEGG